jgi:hypothetical protein
LAGVPVDSRVRSQFAIIGMISGSWDYGNMLSWWQAT